MKTVVLLDTSAIIYRAFFANPNFRTKTEPTGAVYGFIGTLFKIIKELKPDLMCAAFDVSRSTLKRTELYSGYKAKREAAPEDLILQISRIEEVLDGFNIKRVKIPRCEADDVLGTIASRLSKQNYKVIVVTGDKDLTQIVDENISIALLGKGEGKEGFKIISTQEDVVDYIGVHPHRIPDLFGLIGDTSDGIPGVRKIGPKKALLMLEKYSDLEEIYENLDSLVELPGIGKSLVDNIREDRELAFLSRELATIDKDIEEIKILPEDLEFGENFEKLQELFTILEFKAYLKRIGENSTVIKKIESDSLVNEENGIVNEKKLSVTGNISPLPVTLIDNENLILEIKEILEQEKELFLYANEVGLGISTQNRNFYIPLFHKPLFFKNLEIEKLDFLFKNNYKISAFDVKNLFIMGFPIKLSDINLDTMIGMHLLTSKTKVTIETIGREILDMDDIPNGEEFKKIELSDVEPEKIANFIGKYSEIIKESTPIILEQLEENELKSVWEKIELPLIEVLYNMETNGIKIDTDYFKNFEIELNGKLENIRTKIYEISKKEFNLNSPKQLAEILFVDLEMPVLKKNKTGPSTDVDVLEGLENMGFEIATLLLEHRKLSKLVQTYVEPLPKMIDGYSRLHSSFNQIGTATGRLSSSNPNLQNIPSRSEEGMKIRAGFIADEGNILLGIDYSQIELRVLGDFTEDPSLIRAYNNDVDLHEMTARKIFKIESETEVSREQRNVAKIVNFSLIYGKTAFGLSKELKIPVKEATAYIEAYFEQYPKVKEFEKNTILEAEQNGFVRTYFGRKRDISDINSKNKNLKSQGERMAVNSIIQGTASEIIKVAMIDIYNMIKNDLDIKLLLQVHDELIFEVKKDKAEEYRVKIEKLMIEGTIFKNVKLEVNSHMGNSWAETK